MKYYNYENIKIDDLILIADDTAGNWCYFGNDKAVYYISKKPGCNSGLYATIKGAPGHDSFKVNLIKRSRIIGSDTGSIIPGSWIIKNKAYFDNLGIK